MGQSFKPMSLSSNSPRVISSAHQPFSGNDRLQLAQRLGPPDRIGTSTVPMGATRENQL